MNQEALEHAEPSLPGIDSPSEDLDRSLAESLAGMEEGYEPRTEHLHEDGSPEFTNRLIREGSPYLLQHAHNPVNWHAWSTEVFEKARALGRPILLSVGYATCHWCHVMERESFEDEEIAAFINSHFVAIKVDREERPDIDDAYMRAVHLLTRRGGWPMTVIMTPDGDPFFAGTYFPPRDGVRGSRRGFLTILQELSAQYQESPTEVLANAQSISQRMQQLTAPQPPGGIPTERVMARTFQALDGRFDERFGGFGRAPKFPQPSQLLFLLRHARRTGNERARHIASETLIAMSRGGIYDHAAGGFHRYSTDPRWLVPHFEKMLYDNAQLAETYLEASVLTRDARFERTTRRTLDYIAREMTSPTGGFYSATDADNLNAEGENEEGQYFTWTPSELEAAVPDEAQRAYVAELYQFTPRGNFEGRTILSRAVALESADIEGLDDALLRMREYREANRNAPLRDEKILTAWSSMMASAFVRAGFVLGEPSYTHAGKRGVDYLVANSMREGQLFRSVREGRDPQHRATLEDYAHLIRACLDLVEFGGEHAYLARAIALQEALDAAYWDETNGGYFQTANDAEQLVTREKPSRDGAMPSGNAVAADNLLRLAAITQDDAYRTRVDQTFRAFSRELNQGMGATRFLCALDRSLSRELEIVIAGPEDSRAALREVLRTQYEPGAVLLEGTDEELAAIAERAPIAAGKRGIGEGAAAYVCERGRCEQPATDARTLRAQLDARRETR